MILGYIVTNTKIKNIPNYIQVVSAINDDIVSKPCLIIGLNQAKSLIQNFNILQKKYGDYLFWTFKKTEKRIEYEKDINAFNLFLIREVIKNIPYCYVSIFKLKVSNVKNLLYLLKENKLSFYITDKTYFMLYQNKVYGFSKNDLEYISIKKEHVMKLIEKHHIIYENDIPYQYRIFFKKKPYIITYIYNNDA